MNIKKLIVIVIILLCILLLLFSTKMVLAIPQKGYYLVKKSVFTGLENINSNLSFRVDSFNRNQDIRQTVDISGYAYFSPSLSELVDKEIVLHFWSPKVSYRVDASLSDRFDLRSQLTLSNVTGYKHGFRTTFSPLGMANGTYELYIYCYEDEENVGYVKTDKVFIKQYGEFFEENKISP